MPIARFHKLLPSCLSLVCRLNVGSDEYSKLSMTIAILVQLVERRLVRPGHVTNFPRTCLLCCREVNWEHRAHHRNLAEPSDRGVADVLINVAGC